MTIYTSKLYLAGKKRVAMDNLEKLTVTQIKDWGIHQGLKVPSTLRKNELILHLLGQISERENGILRIKNTVSSLQSTLEPRFQDFSSNWMVDLHVNGWCVVPIPNWDPGFTGEFMGWFESFCPNFDRRNPKTWVPKNLPEMLHGILKQYIGQTELLWKIRELCLPIFQEIWGTDDLLCSFDGGCFLTPQNKPSQHKQWIHVDQMRGVNYFACVQGVVNFEENGPEDGGLVLVEGSQDVFEEYMKEHPSEGYKWGTSNIGHPLLSERKLVKICSPPGHLILWDSRVFHSNTHPSGSTYRRDGTPRFRMCTYVSMQPREGSTPQELQRRVKTYQKGKMTSHWCYGPYFKVENMNPRQRTKELSLRPSQIILGRRNSLRDRLIGY